MTGWEEQTIEKEEKVKQHRNRFLTMSEKEIVKGGRKKRYRNKRKVQCVASQKQKPTQFNPSNPNQYVRREYRKMLKGTFEGTSRALRGRAHCIVLFALPPPL
jgi:hypothetical protein